MRPTRTGNRRGQGDRLRGELLDAGWAILTEPAGPAALSLRAVAARAGVAATSVYLHFPDLAAIKLALAERAFAAFSANRTAAVEGMTEPAEALIRACQAYAQWASAHPGPYRLMFSADTSRLVADVTGPSRSAFDALVTSVGRCRDAGLARADGDPQWIATLLWSALHGQVTLRADRRQFPWPPIDEMIADLVVRVAGLS